MESKTAITKEQIVNLSRDVFRKLGYTKVTMADIAEAVNMGRSSLYYYFKNKEEVFTAVAGSEFSGILDKAQNKLKANNSFYDNFLAFNKERLTLLHNIQNDYDNLLDDIREHPGLLYILRNIHFDREFGIYKQMLQWAMRRRDIAPISADDLQFLITNMIYAFKGLEQEIFLFGKVEELTDRLEWVSSIISKGLQ